MKFLGEGHQLWLIGGDAEKEAEAKRLAGVHGVLPLLRTHPWTEGAELSSLLVAADIGVGSLALDRNHMSEAQPMKIAAYLSLGLPVLINFRDIRLDPDAPFVAQIDSLDPRELAKGVSRLLSQPASAREGARAFAADRLTWPVAARETADFLARVIGLESKTEL